MSVCLETTPTAILGLTLLLGVHLLLSAMFIYIYISTVKMIDKWALTHPLWSIYWYFSCINFLNECCHFFRNTQSLVMCRILFGDTDSCCLNPSYPPTGMSWSSNKNANLTLRKNKLLVSIFPPKIIKNLDKLKQFTIPTVRLFWEKIPQSFQNSVASWSR